MKRDEYFERWSQAHNNVNPSDNIFVAGYLSLMHPIVSVLVSLRVSPNVVSLIGGSSSSAALLWGALNLPKAGVAFIVLAGLFVDAFDGALAIATDRVTRAGAVIDSVMDRIHEAAMIGAITLIVGHNFILPAVLAIFLTNLHEYMRAKAQSVSNSDREKITIFERPTRAIIVIAGFIVASMASHVGIALTTILATTLWTWISLSAIALLQLVPHFKRIIS